MSQAVITRLECLVDDVARVNRPNGRHRRVWSPVRETDLAAHGVVQIAHICIALFAKALDRLPGVDVFESNLLDPKIVIIDDTDLHLSWAAPHIDARPSDLG